MSTLVAANLPAHLAVEAARLSRVERAYDDDARWFRGVIARGQGDASTASKLERSEIGRVVHLALLGELLLGEDPSAGDRVVIGAHLYQLVPTGQQTTIKIAGQWEQVDGFTCRYLGDAPLPGSDDEDFSRDDWHAELRADYHRAVMPC